MKIRHYLQCIACSFAMQSAAAADDLAQERFSSICIEKEGTGFNWKNGEWVNTNFVSNTYVARKIFPDELQADHNPDGCAEMLRKKPFGSNGWASVQACYHFGELGEDGVSFWCWENYEQKAEDNNTLALSRVDCNFFGIDISFEPDGPFIYSSTHAIVTRHPEDNYKDSLKISHGLCSKIE